MTPTDLLDLPLGENDAQAATVRDYLKALLTELWREEEGFSGKRPFGNSGWQWDLYTPMVAAGVIPGIGLDEDGEIEAAFWYDNEKRTGAERMVLEAIKAL